MEKIALYRKYRPQDFDAIVGQTAIVKSLCNHVISTKINHAYIFAGTKGAGKTSLAKIYAKAINCEHSKNGNPCNQCVNCQAINASSCSDVLELDAASNNGVNEIRAIIDAVNYVPNQLKYKVYIIDEAHMLTSSSWNALLKTLEEPPSHVVLIFATTEFHKIPATIISRCQRFDFTKIDKTLLNKLLTNVAAKEAIKIVPEALHGIITLANGSARDALSILDQLANYTNKDINASAINVLFGLVDINQKIQYLNALLNRNLDLCLKMINDFNQGGINFMLLTQDLLEIVMDKIIFNDTRKSELLSLLDEQLIELIDFKSENEYVNIMKILNGALTQIKISSQPEMIFEYYSLLICKDDVRTDENEQIKINQTKPNNTGDKQAFKTTPVVNNQLFKTSEFIVEKKLAAGTSIAQTALIQPTKTKIVAKPTLNKPIIQPAIDDLSHPQSLSVEQMYDDSFKHDFFCIANNYNKELSTTLNKTLDELKQVISINPPQIQLLLGAEKVLLASPNGCVLLFNNISQVKHFNQNKNSHILHDFYLENFKHNQAVIAVDINKAKELKMAFQNLDKKDFSDVKINDKVSDDKKTKLLNILNNDDTNI